MNPSAGARRLLVADVGNSSTQIGIFDGDTLVRDWRISSSLSRTADELEHLVRAFLAEGGVGADLDGAVVCSVVPTLTGGLSDAFAALAGSPPIIVDGDVDLGIVNHYADPHAVGPDRLANAVGAAACHRVPAIVVDFGTATTFDVIGGDGSYLGGTISPGMRTSADALFQRASRLPRVELAVPSSAIGRTTTESIQAGVVRGAGILVDGLVAAMQDELGEKAFVIATGGDARLLEGLTQSVDVIDLTLTLKGLRVIAERLHATR